MDVVVAYIPPKFGMLLSILWAVKLKGTLQMENGHVICHHSYLWLGQTVVQGSDVEIQGKKQNAAKEPPHILH